MTPTTNKLPYDVNVGAEIANCIFSFPEGVRCRASAIKQQLARKFQVPPKTFSSSYISIVKRRIADGKITYAMARAKCVDMPTPVVSTSDVSTSKIIKIPVKVPVDSSVTEDSADRMFRLLHKLHALIMQYGADEVSEALLTINRLQFSSKEPTP